MSFQAIKRAHELVRGEVIRFMVPVPESDGDTWVETGTVESVHNDPYSTLVIFDDGATFALGRNERVEILNAHKR